MQSPPGRWIPRAGKGASRFQGSREAFMVSLLSWDSGKLEGCRGIHVWRRQVPSFVAVAREEDKKGSHGGFVLPSTAPAHDTTVVAGAQGQVTAHTRGQEGQGDQSHPPEAKLLVAGVARAGVCVVALGV